MTEPVGEIDTRYSAPDAVAPAWATVEDLLTEAQIYWLSTVRPDARPHVTPVIAIWADRSVYFCTGSGEQKARNLAAHPGCVVTTGANTLNEGLDVVVDGDAERVTDAATLQRIAAEYEAKYGNDWAFSVAGEGFSDRGQVIPVFRIRAQVVVAHTKGDFAMVRYRVAAP